MDLKILLLGNYRQTVTVVRSLARAGFEVVLGQDRKDCCAQYSRFCCETWDHPTIEDSDEEFCLALDEFCMSRPDISLVFPIGESPLRCLTRNASRFPTLTFVMPSQSALLDSLDKKHSYEAAAHLNIPVASWALAHGLDDLSCVAQSVGYPVIVKPNDSSKAFFGRKAVICRNETELETEFDSWPEGNEFLIVQRYIESDRPNCHFRAHRGQLLEYFEHRVIRTDRLDETGYEIEGISVEPSPLLRDYCALLIEHLQYSGVGCIQFLVDRSDGAIYFLEINPRLDATCALPYACGFDFPKYAVECVTAPIDFTCIRTDYSVGTRIHYMVGDLQGFVHAIEDRSLRPADAALWLCRMAKSFLVAQVHMTFAWNDPRPAIQQCAGLFTPFHKRIRKGLTGLRSLCFQSNE